MKAKLILVFCLYVFSQKKKCFCFLFLNENHLDLNMRYCLFLHSGLFLLNLGKGYIRTNMHTTVHMELFIFKAREWQIEIQDMTLPPKLIWYVCVKNVKITRCVSKNVIQKFKSRVRIKENKQEEQCAQSKEWLLQLQIQALLKVS